MLRQRQGACVCRRPWRDGPCPQVYYPVRHHLVQHMVSAMQRLGFTPSVTIEQRRLAVDLSEVVIKWELQRIKDQQVGRQRLPPAFPRLSLERGRQSLARVCLFQPDSDMDPNSSGEGVTSVSSSIKRGLSVDSAQEVKRFRTATGAISAVRARVRATSGSFIWTRNAGRAPTPPPTRPHRCFLGLIPFQGWLGPRPFSVTALLVSLLGVPWGPEQGPPRARS